MGGDRGGFKMGGTAGGGSRPRGCPRLLPELAPSRSTPAPGNAPPQLQRATPCDRTAGRTRRSSRWSPTGPAGTAQPAAAHVGHATQLGSHPHGRSPGRPWALPLHTTRHRLQSTHAMHSSPNPTTRDCSDSCTLIQSPCSCAGRTSLRRRCRIPPARSAPRRCTSCRRPRPSSRCAREGGT
jgi:hypothetical protein